MRTQRLALSILALGLLLLSPILARAQDGGVIRGQVVNGTADGGSTEGLEVTLRVFQGQSESDSLVTLTDAQGRFRFDGLDTDGTWTYVAQATYRDVVYSSGPLEFEPGESETEAEIAVYETTTDAADIAISRAHILIDMADNGAGRPGSILVAELYVFSNPMDRTLVGVEEVQGRRVVSRFLLPQDAYNVSFSDGSLGGRFLAIDGGLADTEPLWPGTTTVMYRYAQDCSSGRCDLSRVVTHPISDLNVLIADAGAQVESDGLTYDRTVGTEAGGFYLSYVGHDLAPGESLSLNVRLSRTASAGTALSQPSSVAWPWIILCGVASVLVLGYPFWRHQVQASARTDTSGVGRRP